MLKVLIPTIIIFPTIWLTSPKWLWTATTAHGLLIAFISLSWFTWTSEAGWTSSNTYLATDPLSTPLLVLTCWLLPLIILASQNHINPEPLARQRLYISLLTSLQAFYILYYIWSHPYSYTYYYYPLRKSNRTPQRRYLFFILHPSRLPASFSGPTAFTTVNRNSIFTNYPIHPTYTDKHMKPQNLMGRLFNRVFSQNTSLWCTSLVTKSTCRSPRCRIHSSSRNSAKTWGLRNDTHNNNIRPTL